MGFLRSNNSRYLLIALGGNGILGAAKLVLANLSGSVALRADALHSFTDLGLTLALGLILYLQHRAQSGGPPRPQTAERAERILSTLVGIAILAVAWEIVRSLGRYQEEELAYLGLVTFLQGGLILFTYLLARMKIIIGRGEESLGMESDGRHTRADMYSSLAVFAALLGKKINLDLEPAAGFIIFVLVAREGPPADGGAFPGLQPLPGSPPGTLFRRLLPRWQEQTRLIRLFPLPLLLFLLLIPGVETVPPGHQCAIRRAGRFTAPNWGPGIHYSPWYFLEERTTLNTSALRVIETGFQGPSSRIFPGPGESSEPGGVSSLPPRDYLFFQWETPETSSNYSVNPDNAGYLTGDGQLAQIYLQTEYTIAEPIPYLTSYQQPEALLEEILQSELTRLVSGLSLHEVLLQKRTALARSLESQVRRRMEDRHTGLALRSIRLFSAHPPGEASGAYRTVPAARQEYEKQIYQAQAYRERHLPYADALAQEKKEKAQARAEEILSRARREPAVFRALRRAYQANPGEVSFRKRLDILTEALEGRPEIYLSPSVPPGLIRLNLSQEETP